jgi:hypothetical protein
MMKHLHHQQVLLPPAHRQAVPPQQQVPYVVHVASPIPKKPSSSSLEINLLGLVGLFCIFVFILYVLAMSLGPQFLLDSDEASPLDSRAGRLRRGSGGSGGRTIKSPAEDEEDATCFRSLEQERRARANLVEQLKQLELDLTEEKKKFRELEREYRDLALSSRAAVHQPATKQLPQQGVEDVSTLQRLAKCRQAVEESTQTIKDLRDHSKSLDSQVTRLQKELREAVDDADEQEKFAMECDKKLKRLGSSSVYPKKEPPPPSPD